MIQQYCQTSYEINASPTRFKTVISFFRDFSTDFITQSLLQYIYDYEYDNVVKQTLIRLLTLLLEIKLRLQENILKHSIVCVLHARTDTRRNYFF